MQVGPEHNTHFEGLFKVWITQLSTILPPGTNIPAAYERGSDQDQDFVQNLAIFLTTFFRVLPLMNFSCVMPKYTISLRKAHLLQPCSMRSLQIVYADEPNV